MEFVDGVTLAAVLRDLEQRKERLAPDRMVRILRRVLQVLDYAHSRGIVHRDLKPGNIMLVRPGTDAEDVRLLDFGIAKVVRGATDRFDLPSLNTLGGIGTPHYMAPEQLRGKAFDGRTDLYALGVILYQMCAGCFPFKGDSDIAVVTARLVDDPDPLPDDPPTPDWMRALVFSLLERSQDKRPSTREVLELLLRRESMPATIPLPTPAEQASIPTRPNSPSPRIPTPPPPPEASSPPAQRSRSRATQAFGALAAVLVLSLAAWALFFRGDSSNSAAGDSGERSEARLNEGPKSPERLPEKPTPPADRDGDGVPDERDLCADDANKSSPGVCGCGVADTDTDSDGVLDCNDRCPEDANKIAPGVCGCGTPDVDTDGDGVLDCKDGCPTDPHKTAPGQCGCGAPERDSDGDKTPDCIDKCPEDPKKIAPGACGCGVPDADRDGDGTLDCNDRCPDDPNKIAPGVCGCGKPDADSDGDGTLDCEDECPNDPRKIKPGLCGCGVADTDSDGDKTPDCTDGCPNDPKKLQPGICGCGVSDADSDGDGTLDCKDGCPNDPKKTAPGKAGCGNPEPDERLAWAEVLEAQPDPKVVTDAQLRAAIQATGLPWRVRDRRSKIELLLVPPGSYKRGASPGDTEADGDESPAHTVQITKAFYLGRYEVTESEWKRVNDNVDAPVALGTPQRNVSHDDIVGWLARAPGLRLPTEGEWEYACRAGSGSARYGELNDVAVCLSNSGNSVARVGTKRANALGFHDMLGNVYEWCSDWYGPYDSLRSGVTDPPGPASGDFRVVRGGSFAGFLRYCRASNRSLGGPAGRVDNFGFRVSRTP